MRWTLAIGSAGEGEGEADSPNVGREKAAGMLALAAGQLLAGQAAAAAGWLRCVGEQLAGSVPEEDRQIRALQQRISQEHPEVIEREMGGMLGAILEYDAYFGIGRVHRCRSEERAIAAVPLIGAIARDLPVLPMTLDAKAALAAFASRLIGSGLVGDPAPEVSACEQVDAIPHLDPDERWRCGHLLYSLANRMAAHRIEAALDAAQVGDLPRACELLLEGRRELVAASAAMELAAAVTREEYCREIRPTMCPPRLKVALTGTMNADHQALRQALSRLCTELGCPTDELADSSSRLALAREQLLHADLSDIERHIVLSLRLIGSGPALDEATDQSAVQSLRKLYLRRLGRYLPMLQGGSRTLGGQNELAVVGDA